MWCFTHDWFDINAILEIKFCLKDTILNKFYDFIYFTLLITFYGNGRNIWHIDSEVFVHTFLAKS